ncbi:hypothetical protein KCU81_g4105, partial [Aureobasidium melanogenum]|uniref:Uncharacterized protein n=1 Tax=Aureobasidium melanogenum (strain CBS 110374) TaxID=1043003 RepID=A0A074VIK2_AURM1
METIRNAANAAANYVGLGGTTEENREGESSHIAGGEAPQNVATGTSQSGVEPVSGKLGRGEAGEPYDAGNVDGASGLGGSTVQNTSSDYTSQSTTGYGSGLTGSNTTSSRTTNSQPLSEKVRETFGVGGGDRHAGGLGSREDGPGYGTSSKRDKDNSLGSVVGHGSNPDKYLYNAKTAPGLGGHRIGDDFTDSNTRHEGAASLPSKLGSDAAAGKSGAQSSSGGLTGRSGNDSYSSGTGETLTQKAKDYLPGTSSQSNTQNDSALAGAQEVIGSSGRNEPGYGSSTYGSSNTSTLPVRTHDSSSTTADSLTPGNVSGASFGGTGSGLTGTSSGTAGGLTGSSTTGMSQVACEEEREGYKPHGGHPIGEAAHVDGKQTWLDYRNDPNLPVARAEPGDL